MHCESYNFSQVESLAASVGIDFLKAYCLVLWDGVWKNNVPVLHPKHEGKASIISSRYGNRNVITFHNRSGERSVTWSSYDNSIHNECATWTPSINQQSRDAYTEQLFQRYAEMYTASSSYPTNDFPYLKKKKVKGVDKLPLLTDFAPGFEGRDFLAIPMFKDHKLVAIQRIYADGKKSFVPGSKVKGACHVISAKEADSKFSTVYVCEGWATGWTIHQLTGRTVYCTMSLSNLSETVKELSEQFQKVIVASDNDQWGSSGNHGLSAGLELAKTTGVQVRYPVFDEEKIKGKPTDFNDLYCLQGMRDTAYQLTKCKASILRAPRNKMELELSKVSFCGTKEESQTKTIKSCVGAFIEAGYSEEECIDFIRDKNRYVSKDIIKHTYGLMYATHGVRVARCHTINPANHSDVDFINLPLVKEDHGGYSIDKEFYKQIAERKGIIIINAPMGTGKTERIMKPIIDAAGKGAYVAHRSALVEECCNRMQIPSYRNLKDMDIRELDKVGCCINSITNPKFGGGKWFSKLDALCIDEVTKLLHHLTHAPVENPEKVLNVLLKVIDSAGQVVMADADANDNLVRLLQQHTKQRITVVNCEVPDKDTSVTTTTFENAFKYLTKSVGKARGICAFDSKRDIEKIKLLMAQRHPKAKVLAVTSETKGEPEVAKWIKDPNRYSKNYDLVLFNSAVDSGISITTKDFAFHVGLFRGVVTPESIIQMMGRYRTSQHWMIGFSPVNKTCYGDKIKHRIEALKTANAALSSDDDTEDEDIGITTFDKFKLAMGRAEVLSRKNVKITLNVMLGQKGYKVDEREVNSKFVVEERKLLKELGEEVTKNQINLILSSKTPTKEEYKELSQSYFLTKKQKAQIDRYEMYQNLCISKITEKAAYFWTQKPRLECIFENFQTPEAKLNKHWQREAETISSHTLRENLHIKGKILKKLFEILGVDLNTGEGEFTRDECQEFLDYLVKEKLCFFWNYAKLGSFFPYNKEPKDSTKFVKSCLKKMGLVCDSNRSTGHHRIRRSSWNYVQTYVNLREIFEQNIANLDAEERDISEIIETEHLERENELSDDLKAEVTATLEAEFEAQVAEASSTELAPASEAAGTAEKSETRGEAGNAKVVQAKPDLNSDSEEEPDPDDPAPGAVGELSEESSVEEDGQVKLSALADESEQVKPSSSDDGGHDDEDPDSDDPGPGAADASEEDGEDLSSDADDPFWFIGGSDNFEPAAVNSEKASAEKPDEKSENKIKDEEAARLNDEEFATFSPCEEDDLWCTSISPKLGSKTIENETNPGELESSEGEKQAEIENGPAELGTAEDLGEINPPENSELDSDNENKSNNFFENFNLSYQADLKLGLNKSSVNFSKSTESESNPPKKLISGSTYDPTKTKEENLRDYSDFIVRETLARSAGKYKEFDALHHENAEEFYSYSQNSNSDCEQSSPPEESEEDRELRLKRMEEVDKEMDYLLTRPESRKDSGFTPKPGFDSLGRPIEEDRRYEYKMRDIIFERINSYNWDEYKMPHDENGKPVVQDDWVSVFYAVKNDIEVPRHLYIKHVGLEPRGSR